MPFDRQSIEFLKSKNVEKILATTDKLKAIEKSKKWQSTPNLEATYKYVHSDGTTAFEVLRYNNKNFVFKSLVEPNEWKYGYKYIEPILYNLNEVAKEENTQIVIAEGEKDVDTLTNLGYVATTNPFGAAKGNWHNKFNKWFKNKDVIIFPDNDAIGLRHAETIAQNIYPIASSIKIVLFKSLKVKQDISDWIEMAKRAGRSKSQIKKAINKMIKDAELYIIPSDNSNDNQEGEQSQTEESQFLGLEEVADTQDYALTDLSVKPSSKNSSLSLLSCDNSYPQKLSFKVPIVPRINKILDRTIIDKKPAILSSPTHLKVNDLDEDNSTSEHETTRNNPHIQNSDDSNVLSASQLESIIASKTIDDQILNEITNPEDDLSYEDFYQYQYLYNPLERGIPDGNSLDVGSEFEKERIKRLLNQIYRTIGQVVEGHYPKSVFRSNGDMYCEPERWRISMKSVTDSIYELFFYASFSEMYVYLAGMTDGSADKLIMIFFRNWLTTLINESKNSIEMGIVETKINAEVFQRSVKEIIDAFLEAFPETKFDAEWPSCDTYDFKRYPEGSVNFGLRVAYRQTQKFMGYQKGKIERTLPLGPKQSINVSTKISQKEKKTSNMENFLSLERNSESTERTKNTSEFINENQSQFEIEAKIKAQGNAGFIKASAELNTNYKQSSSSRDAKTAMSEASKKSASKSKRETKVVVSTEFESNYEETNSSVITNPNDEIAVTYVYSRLSQKYNISTRLSEVNSVVYIAEKLPEPYQINESWIRKYDTILAENMLDSSLLKDLAMIRHQYNTDESSPGDDDIKAFMKKAKDSLAEFKDIGGTIPDIFKAPQDAYERSIQRKIQQKREKAANDRRIQRVKDHIVKNILHYSQAIWESEDLDVRLQRYSDIQVPVNWKYKFNDSTKEGYFESVVKNPSQDLRSLSEIINPAGPIGYSVNYSIWYLKNDTKLNNLNQALRFVRSQFVKCNVDVKAGKNNSGNLSVRAIVENPSAFKLKLTLNSKTKKLWTDMWANDEWIQMGQPISFENFSTKKTINLLGTTVIFEMNPHEKQLCNTESWEIEVLPTHELEDPEMLFIRKENPLPDTGKEKDFFTPDVIESMTQLMPQIQKRIAHEENLHFEWQKCSDETRNEIRRCYHAYLLKKMYSTDIVVDTNNLMLDLAVGSSSALEKFKQKHREIDVFQALEETKGIQLDNLRKIKLMEKGEFTDPDIDKKIVINSHGNVTTPIIGE